MLLAKVATILPVTRLPLLTPLNGFIAGRLIHNLTLKKRLPPAPIEEPVPVKISPRKLFFVKLGLKLLRVKKKDNQPTTIRITIE